MQNVGIFSFFLFFFLTRAPSAPSPSRVNTKSNLPAAAEAEAAATYTCFYCVAEASSYLEKKSDFVWSNWLAIATAPLCLLSHRRLSDTSPAFIIFMYMRMSPRLLACRWVDVEHKGPMQEKRARRSSDRCCKLNLPSNHYKLGFPTSLTSLPTCFFNPTALKFSLASTFSASNSGKSEYPPKKKYFL